MKSLVIKICVFLILPVILFASVVVNGNDLVLNGNGLRKKLFIKVYQASLYLPKKNNNASQIINADEPSAIVMKFIYSEVKASQLINAWQEGFESNRADMNVVGDAYKKFISFYTSSAKAGDIHKIEYVPGKGVSLYINDELKGTISGLEFKKALYSVWLGDKPADSGLKDGMLGK